MRAGSYQTICGLFPLFLVATAHASKLRWPATAATLVYMGMILINHWIMPLVPAEPKLGPVRQQITHMVAGPFPLLLVAQALAIDWLQRRASGWSRWRLAVALGAAFFFVFLAVQWPFASFLMSPASRNWVFGTNQFAYFVSPTSYEVRHRFAPWDATTSGLLWGLASSLPLAVLSSRLGLAWGGWMRKVQR